MKVTNVARSDGSEAAARRFGVSPSTVRRWVSLYDPAHPRASLKAGRTGPRGPRLRGEPELFALKELATSHPAWGRRRLAAALALEGMGLSESTVSRLLRELRERQAQEVKRQAREEASAARLAARTDARRSEREGARVAAWNQLLEPVMESGLSAVQGTTPPFARRTTRGRLTQDLIRRSITTGPRPARHADPA